MPLKMLLLRSPPPQDKSPTIYPIRPPTAKLIPPINRSYICISTPQLYPFPKSTTSPKPISPKNSQPLTAWHKFNSTAPRNMRPESNSIRNNSPVVKLVSIKSKRQFSKVTSIFRQAVYRGNSKTPQSKPMDNFKMPPPIVN